MMPGSVEADRFGEGFMNRSARQYLHPFFHIRLILRSCTGIVDASERTKRHESGDEASIENKCWVHHLRPLWYWLV